MHHPIATGFAASDLSLPALRWRLGAGLAAVLLSACAVATEPAKLPRPIEPDAVVHKLDTPLPPGRVEAMFRFDTGGDRTSSRRAEAGLWVVVRWGDTESRRMLASCARPSGGTALGGGTERELDVAICDGEFWLISEPGRVTVQRLDGKAGPREVARFDLPGSLRAAKPSNR